MAAVERNIPAKASLEAETVVEDLSELFRASLNDAGNQVPLAEELDLCERYVRIEALRLGDRLQVDWSVDEDTRSQKIPMLSIQPLVENAIKHGFANHSEAGTILVSAKRFDNDKIELIVKDDGKGTAEFTQNLLAKGIGLKNMTSRVSEIGGKISFFSEPGNGTTVKLKIPYSV